MSKKQKKTLVRIILSAVLLVAAALIPVDGIVKLVLFLIPYAVIGWDVLWKAIRNIAHGQVFDENFLMAIATVGAFALGEYPESCCRNALLSGGRAVPELCRGAFAPVDRCFDGYPPDYANIEQDGKLVQVDPEDVAVGDTDRHQGGRKDPAGRRGVGRRSAVDTAALTGESLPRDVDPGDDVVSGCINQSGLLKVRVTKVFGESTVAKILDLVENSSSKKARAENFITRFARYYTPVVVIGAVLLAVLPPLLFGGDWSDWLQRALIFLVISCRARWSSRCRSAFSVGSAGPPSRAFWSRAATIWRRWPRPRRWCLTRPVP